MELLNGSEWSPQEWLPQPKMSNRDLEYHRISVIRAIFQSVAKFPELADETIGDFTQAWSGNPNFPLNSRLKVSDLFEVSNGQSTGEKNYAEGTIPYVSSGDALNSIIRLISPVGSELFKYGAITVTAFGNASVQPWAFMARGNGGSSVRVLKPRFKMNFMELVWFSSQINVQRWRFFYARMSIKSRLERLVIASPSRRLPYRLGRIAKDVKKFRDSLDQFSALPR